jgi:hypothetical protein
MLSRTGPSCKLSRNVVENISCQASCAGILSGKFGCAKSHPILSLDGGREPHRGETLRPDAERESPPAPRRRVPGRIHQPDTECQLSALHAVACRQKSRLVRAPAKLCLAPGKVPELETWSVSLSERPPGKGPELGGQGPELGGRGPSSRQSLTEPGVRVLSKRQSLEQSPRQLTCSSLATPAEIIRPLVSEGKLSVLRRDLGLSDVTLRLWTLINIFLYPAEPTVEQLI